MLGYQDLQLHSEIKKTGGNIAVKIILGQRLGDARYVLFDFTHRLHGGFLSTSVRYLRRKQPLPILQLKGSACAASLPGVLHTDAAGLDGRGHRHLHNCHVS